MSEPIRWRGIVLSPRDEPDAWSYDSDKGGREEDALQVWIAKEYDGSFSAAVVLGFIEGEGASQTPEAALELALDAVRSHLAWANEAVRRIFR